MRKLINIILVTAVLALGLLLAIAAETDNQNPKKPSNGIDINLSKEEIPKLVEIIWIWKLVDELELKEEQLMQFIPRFKELGDLRGRYYRDRRGAITEMSKLLKANAPDSKLESIADKFRSIEVEFRQEEKQLQKSLNSGLTAKQQAKFIVFQDGYRRDMGRLVRNLRELSNLREQPLRHQPKPLQKKE